MATTSARCCSADSSSPPAAACVRIEVPDAWHCVVVHPDAVLETRRAREALRGNYTLEEFVAQSGNLALVLAGCHRGDADLVRAGLADVLSSRAARR